MYIDSEYDKKIKDLYFEIFDEKGRVKAVGREKCKELMKILYYIYGDIDFGDLESGFMNIENIRKYVFYTETGVKLYERNDK